MKSTWKCKGCEAFVTLQSLQQPTICNICNGSNFESIMTEISDEEIATAKMELGKCYEDIIKFIGEWMDISDDNKKLIAIWIIGTYFHKSFSTYPYLFFNAVKGSGKSRLLEIISWLQFNGNGNVLCNPSDSVLFRTAKDRGLILDEFESEKSKDKQTMREYLNACYKKGGSVYRMEKQKVGNKEMQVAVPYPLFTPVAMANINGIEEVLADRSITLILEKSMNPALVKKIQNFSENPVIKDLKVRLSKFSVYFCSVDLVQNGIEKWNEYITQLHTIHTIHTTTQPYIQLNIQELEIFNKINDTGIYGRNLELFFPLLSLASIINCNIFEELLPIAKSLNAVKKEDEYAESKEVSLIEFVSKAEKYRFNSVFVHDLLREFKEFIGTHGEEEERWINLTWMGLALKKLKLIGSKRRVAKGIQVLLAVDHAKEKLKIFKTTDEVKDETKN